MKYYFICCFLLLNALDLLSQFQYKDREIWYANKIRDTIQFKTKEGVSRWSYPRKYNNRYELMRLNDSLWMFDVLVRCCFTGREILPTYHLGRDEIMYFQASDSVFAFHYKSRKFHFALSQKRFFTFRKFGDRLMKYDSIMDLNGQLHAFIRGKHLYSFRGGISVSYNSQMGKYGLINDNGQYIVPAEYKKIRLMRDSIVLLWSQEYSLCYLDVKKSRKIGPTTYARNSKGYVNPFLLVYEHNDFEIANGVIRFCDKGLLGLMDTIGRVILPPTYKEISRAFGVNANLRIVSYGGGEGVINESGKLLLECRYYIKAVKRSDTILAWVNDSIFVFNFSKDMVSKRFIGVSEEIVIKSALIDGMFVYEDNKLQGLMDTNFVRVTEPSDKGFSNACNGIFSFCASLNKYSFFSNGKTYIVPCGTDTAVKFDKNGVAMVVDNGDHYARATNFIKSDGTFLFEKDGHYYHVPDKCNFCEEEIKIGSEDYNDE